MTKPIPYLLWIPIGMVLLCCIRFPASSQTNTFLFVEADSAINPHSSFDSERNSKQPHSPRPLVQCRTDFSILTSVCVPNEIVFVIGDSSSMQTRWETGDGTEYNNLFSPAHRYADTGTYTVRLFIDKNGCKDTLDRLIHIGSEWANILLTPDTTVCAGTYARLRSRIDTNFNFCWLPANLLDNPSSPSPLTTSGGTTQYRLSGVALSGNLLVNGDFSQGNSSFQSDYVVSATAPSLAGTGQYAVYDSTVYAVPGAAACGNFLDGFGNRLIVRNNATDSARIWSSAVRIRPHTRYALSCRVQPVFNNSEATLQFAVDDAAIGGLMNISAMACGWSLHQVIWNAGTDTLVNLSIINRSTAGGACFAIDDIRFAEYRTVQDSVRISVDTPMINTIDNQSTCRGVQVALTTTGGVRYRWVPATAVSDSVGASPIVSPADTLQFFVTGTTAAGCSATDSVEINILPTPAIDKSPDTSICRGDSAFLRVTGGQTYVWSPAQTLSASDIPNPAAGPVSNTTYYVSSSDPAFGCVATDSIRVRLRAAAQFTLSASADSVCAGNPLQLTATGGTDYRWQPAGLLNNAEIADPIARPMNTTLFVVQIFDSVCNAIGVLSRRIVAKPLPRLILTKSNDIDCFDLNARLSVSGADTVRWFAEKLPLYLSDSSIFNPIAFPSSTKKYYVTGADTLSGCTRIDSIIVYSYLKGNPPFIAPNSFTPNGDGLNDCWRAIPESRLLFFELSVYNRLGNRVFFTRNPNECWNGTYQGTPQDPGNYVYYIKASNNCKSEVSSGNLLLLR